MKNGPQVNRDSLFSSWSAHHSQERRRLSRSLLEGHLSPGDFLSEGTCDWPCSYSALAGRASRIPDGIAGGKIVHAFGASNSAMDCGAISDFSGAGVVLMADPCSVFFDGEIVFDSAVSEFALDADDFPVNAAAPIASLCEERIQRMQSLLENFLARWSEMVILIVQRALTSAVLRLGDHSQLALRRWDGVYSFYRSLIPVYAFSTLSPLCFEWMISSPRIYLKNGKTSKCVFNLGLSRPKRSVIFQAVLAPEKGFRATKLFERGIR